MKSLHVLGSRQFGGADKFYVRLVEALNAAGHEAVAVNRPEAPVARALAAGPTRQIHLPLANKWDILSTARLRRIIRAERPDAVMTYMGRASRLTRVPRELPAPHIARLGGYYKVRGYYDHCDAWVGNTRGVCDYLIKEGLPAGRVFHIGNFVPDPEPLAAESLPTLRGRLALPEDAHVLLALGRFIGIKGFDVLLRAFSRLPREIGQKPLRLLIVGDGPLRDSLHALSRELNLTDRICWAGWQDDPEPFFHLADLLVCPSSHETLGNVILEGWNHGLPVVSTATPGATEIMTDGVDGLLVPVSDPEALADGLRATLRLDPGARAAQIAAGRETLAHRHSRAAVIEAYTDLFARLRGDRRRAPV